MKRLKLLAMTVVLLLCACLLAGCTGTLIAEWPKEHTPQKIIHAGEQWYAMMGSYGMHDAELAVGPAPDKLVTVYKDDASVWKFTATETHAAWLQISEDNVLRWMLFDMQRGETVEIHSEEKKNTKTCLNVCLGDDALYYVRVDEETGEKLLVAHQLADHSETILYLTDSDVGAMRVRDNVAHLAVEKNAEWMLVSLPLNGENDIVQHMLPMQVAIVYDVDYDAEMDVYALYYMDVRKKEHTAVYDRARIDNIYTFAANSYAVDDMLEIADGHLYWALQMNWSGNITDHYLVTDYDLQKGRPVEHDRGYWFSRSDEGLLVLSFGEDGDYKTCVLTVYPYK